MTLCLSPEFSLELFCFRLVAQEGHNLDPVSALDAVAREISAARRQHQHQTKERHFRAESKGRIYCDDLKSVVSLLMNGVVPNPKRDGFLQQ